MTTDNEQTGNEQSKSEQASFDGKNQRGQMREEFEQERAGTDPESFTKTDDELSMGDSIRTYGEVSGTTFGMESNTAKFSNIGQKNQTRKGAQDAGDIESVNEENMKRGSGGTLYSDYLNNAQHEFIGGTGQFSGRQSGDNSSNNASNNPDDQSIRPFDAMQGNRENGSGGKSEDYEGYDPSGDKRPNE